MGASRLRPRGFTGGSGWSSDEPKAWRFAPFEGELEAAPPFGEISRVAFLGIWHPAPHVGILHSRGFLCCFLNFGRTSRKSSRFLGVLFGPLPSLGSVLVNFGGVPEISGCFVGNVLTCRRESLTRQTIRLVASVRAIIPWAPASFAPQDENPKKTTLRLHKNGLNTIYLKGRLTNLWLVLKGNQEEATHLRGSPNFETTANRAGNQENRPLKTRQGFWTIKD